MCLVAEPRPAASEQVVVKLEASHVLGSPAFAEAADSAVGAGLRPEAPFSGAHLGRPWAVSSAPWAEISEAR